MKNSKIIVDKKSWQFLFPFWLGVFVLVNSIIWIILSGGRWFEEVEPGKELPEHYNDLNRVFGPFYMLGYFTVQTNLFVGVMLCIFAFYNYSSNSQSWFMGSVILITITFLVFWLLIAPGYESFRWQNPFFTISSVFLHAVNPIIAFSVLYIIRKDILINKRILGLCALWMAVFYIYSAIFYGVTSQVDQEQAGKIKGSTIYSFLDLQNLFFIDFTSMPILAIFLNLLLLVLCPFLPILVAMLWIKICSIQTNGKSYFRWIDLFKNWKQNKNSLK